MSQSHHKLHEQPPPEQRKRDSQNINSHQQQIKQEGQNEDEGQGFYHQQLDQRQIIISNVALNRTILITIVVFGITFLVGSYWILQSDNSQNNQIADSNQDQGNDNQLIKSKNQLQSYKVTTKKYSAQRSAQKYLNQNTIDPQILKTKRNKRFQKSISKKQKLGTAQTADTQLQSQLQYMKFQKQNLLPLASNLLNLSYSEEKLQQIIYRMQYPPDRPKSIHNAGKSLQFEDYVYFADSLSKQQSNSDFLQAEYYYYNLKYNIGEYGQEEQLPLCVVMVGRNQGQNWNSMLQSVLRQNYSNYHVVMIDDASDDGTNNSIQEFLSNSKHNPLINKIKFIQNTQRKYALYNRNVAIRHYCKTEDIVLDIDIDDWLIGKQVFKLVSAVYKNEQIWACYFNSIKYSKSCHCPVMTADAKVPQEMLKQNKYRVGKIWRTSHLRTFLRKLYYKINEQDFVDESTKKFYKWKSDAFMHYALVQLSGPMHTQFIDEFLYYYNTSSSEPSIEKSYCRLEAKTKPPYRPLKNLQVRAQKQKNYKPPEEFVKELETIKQKMVQ